MMPKRSQEEKTAPLDPHHTHFILVDSGRENEFGGEVKFRANLEDSICSKLKASAIVDPKAAAAAAKADKATVKKKKIKQDIPIVTLVLGGGRNTVRQVLNAIQKGIPCIIFDVI
jgi:hypothetical protein